MAILRIIIAFKLSHAVELAAHALAVEADRQVCKAAL